MRPARPFEQGKEVKGKGREGSVGRDQACGSGEPRSRRKSAPGRLRPEAAPRTSAALRAFPIALCVPARLWESGNARRAGRLRKESTPLQPGACAKGRACRPHACAETGAPRPYLRMGALVCPAPARHFMVCRGFWADVRGLCVMDARKPVQQRPWCAGCASCHCHRRPSMGGKWVIVHLPAWVC